MKKLLPLLACVLALAACSTDKDDKITGDRVPVLKEDSALKPDEALADQPLDLPEAAENESWPQSMGLADAGLGNMAFTHKPEKAWSASVGEGSSDDVKLLARPIVAEGKVFTMDTDAEVRAFALKDGDHLWSASLKPEEYDEEQFGGGVAYSNGRIYATTGYGQIVALDAKSGKELWRKGYTQVIRSAPVVMGERVFAVTADGQTHALNAEDGSEFWTHSGIAETSTLLGNGVPAAADDVLFVPYSSGELYAVRVQNGKTLWQQSLAGSQRSTGGMPALSDIKGSPAIDADNVYAASNAGRMASVDKRTGNVQWDIDLSSVDTPVIAGDTLFVLGERNKVVLIDRKTGKVRSVYPLKAFEDEEAQKKPIYWSGPVIADGVIWLVSSTGKLVGLDPANGEQVAKVGLSDKAYLAPTVAQKTMLIITDDGRLTAYR